MEYAAVLVLVLGAAVILLRRALRAGRRTLVEGKAPDCTTGCAGCPLREVTSDSPCGSQPPSEEDTVPGRSKSGLSREE